MYIKCPGCGATVFSTNNYCPICRYDLRQRNFNGSPTGDNTPQGSPSYNANDIFASDPYGKSRGVAALLAIFLGYLGVQYFYLGKNTAGVICLLITVLSCGILGSILGLLTFIQGIMMICMNNQDFTRKYVASPATFPLF